jgi:hypothetical protein
LQFNLHYGKFGYIVEADIRSFLEPSSYCTPFHERI